MAEASDRRAVERYPVNMDATCPFLSPVAEEFGQAKLRDISMHGVGLLLNRRLEPGVMLTLVLENVARGFSKTVLARVAHVTPLGSSFIVGCNFVTPLSYQEMSTLVL
jgi:hypothetical protein